MLNFTFTPFPNLKTERLALRQLNNKDENALVKLRSDERVNEFIGRSKSISPEEVKKFIDKINTGISKDEAMYWAITLKNEDELIGTICLWNLDKENCKGEVGFELFPEFQGKGLMKEALTKVLDYAFNIMKLHTIEGFANENNIRSIKLMEKYNFKRDTELEKEIAKEDEQFKNMVIYTVSSYTVNS